MKRQLLGVAAILLSISTYAQDNPLWMRYCAISPDGTTIAFTYKGDIYTVPSTGGRASQITTNPAHDTKPIWSPDGKKIAFASDRMGSMDIFEVNKEGGIPKRLTTHSGNETPVAYKDAGHILFLANIMPTVEDAQFPSGQFQQVYEVNTEGGRPALFSSMPMEDISINHTGNTLLYHDKKGYEDPWRKHHTSSITRDIWLCSLNGNRTFRKQTTFNGEDRTPVWASDDKSFYYLSEEKGSFNIFKRDIDGNTSKQITNHTKHPVRFLSAASNGTLCYGYDGEIYTVKEGAIPQKFRFPLSPTRTTKISSARLSVAEQQKYPFHPMQKKLLLYYAEMYMSHQQNTAPPNKSPILRNRNAIFTFLRTEEVLFTLPKETDYGRFIKPV